MHGHKWGPWVPSSWLTGTIVWHRCERRGLRGCMGMIQAFRGAGGLLHSVQLLLLAKPAAAARIAGAGAATAPGPRHRDRPLARSLCSG
jgi:hypothetical protein